MSFQPRGEISFVHHRQGKVILAGASDEHRRLDGDAWNEFVLIQGVLLVLHSVLLDRFTDKGRSRSGFNLACAAIFGNAQVPEKRNRHQFRI